jgi:hypothetical protein
MASLSAPFNRINVSAGHLRTRGDGAPEHLRASFTSGEDPTTMNVTIGSVSRLAPRQALFPHLVPKVDSQLARLDSQELLRHIQFIMKKDNLGQDVMLMGPPGRYRRDVVRLYASLTNREVEYLAVSRDTTFSDLKQRREIRAGTAEYSDQCVVRAAVHGRILLLDGIEKAERNVLPIINNLMENREMSLSDGRFLTDPNRYDELLKTHTDAELHEQGLVRVSHEFRVVALSLPVPAYAGFPLDPPLRSRFQARYVDFRAPSEQVGHSPFLIDPFPTPYTNGDGFRASALPRSSSPAPGAPPRPPPTRSCSSC